MKKWAINLWMVCVLLIMATGCTKKPINEDVEGFWILKSFTTLADGEVHQCNRLYYSITCMVTEVSEKQGDKGLDAYVGRTGYNGNETQLILSDFKLKEDVSENKSTTGDLKENAPVEGLREYGINSQEITVFDIVKCDGKSMILQSDYARLELEKF